MSNLLSIPFLRLVPFIKISPTKKFSSIERKAYYERMEICKTSEGRKKLIIADGMDQTKTNMPHVHQKNKTTEGKQLNTHVFGVTVTPFFCPKKK